MTVLYIILSVIIIFFVITYILYFLTFHRFRKEIDMTKIQYFSKSPYKDYAEDIAKGITFFKNEPCESVYITSYDGLRLAGRYYHTEGEKALLILFHGYRSMPQNDFSRSLEFYLTSGYSVLLVDQRCHGMSEGKQITFGIKERYDCLEWTRYAAERFGKNTKIFIEGLSMGSATVMMASDLEMPENVIGIVADCGYTSPEDIIKKVINETRMVPVKIFYPIVKLGARMFGGFNLEEASAEEALKKSRLPVLFIHGEADKLVPCEMSRRNYGACIREKFMVTVPGAAHGFSYIVDRQKVQEAMETFFEKYCNKSIK